MKHVFFFLLFLLFQFNVCSQLNFEKLPEMDGASISYLVRDMWSGKLVASHDSSRLLAPASTLKLFTTAIALDKLGPQSTQKSSFYINGKIDGGVLFGDLLFDANYNATLLSSRYNQSLNKIGKDLVNALKKNGIRSIKGDLVVIEDVTDVNSIPRTWVWEDMGNYYGAGARRTVVNENKLHLYFQSGEEGSLAKVKKIAPNLSSLIVSSEVTASKINRDLAYCFSRPGDSKINVTGSIPAHRANFLVKASLPDPAGALSMMLKKELKSQGVIVEGKCQVKNGLPSRSVALYSFKSPSLASIVRKTNKHSINVYAETLMNLVALSHSKEGETKAACFKRILGEKFDVEGLKLYDGSGLSRFNAVSSKQTVDLLLWMNKHAAKKSFYDSFSIAGESGTLKYMLANTIAKGRVKGKSGSMEGVRAYAGTINTKKGENLAFSVIVNNYNVSNSQMKKILEKWMWELWNEN